MTALRWTGSAVLGLVLAFLLGPFLVIALAGASAGETMAFPPEGLSLRWYSAVFGMENFRSSFLLSLFLGIGSTAIALVLGIPAAYALARYRLPGAETVRNIVLAPVIVPALIVGLALLRHAVVPLGLGVITALVLAHTALVLPYAVRVTTASLANLRVDVEEAALMLGATRAQAFFRVVLPNIRGGVMAAFVLGFITSFNQVPVSLFLTGPGVSTLPIDMLGALEFVYDPSIAAISTLLALLSLVIMTIAEKLLGISRYV
jgi:putative spermidine/putrescine transport system permease protein